MTERDFSTRPACIVDDCEAVIEAISSHCFELIQIELGKHEFHYGGKVGLELGVNVDGTIAEQCVSRLPDIEIRVLSKLDWFIMRATKELPHPHTHSQQLEERRLSPSHKLCALGAESLDNRAEEIQTGDKKVFFRLINLWILCMLCLVFEILMDNTGAAVKDWLCVRHELLAECCRDV